MRPGGYRARQREEGEASSIDDLLYSCAAYGFHIMTMAAAQTGPTNAPNSTYVKPVSHQPLYIG